MLGKVKRFNPKRGYGFIENEKEESYFFHYTELEMDGFKTVRAGTEVEFEAAEGDRGLVAKSVKLVK